MLLRAARSWVGLATPRVAANASAISSGREEAQRPLVHALGVGAHGEDQHHVRQVDGLAPRRRAHLRRRRRRSASTWPSRTSRLAGLMSRWARPASHSWRTTARPWSITVVVDLGVADLLARRRRTR